MKNIQSDWVTLLNYLGVSVPFSTSIQALLNEFNNLYNTNHLENET
jgi:hypothetical protein